MNVIRNSLRFPQYRCMHKICTAAFPRLCKHRNFLFFVSIENTFWSIRTTIETGINDTKLGGNSAAMDTRPYTTYVYVILTLGDVVAWEQRGEKKRTGRKKDIVEGASADARRIALWDGIARRRPFAITGGSSFFCLVRSGGRTPLVAFDNFIRHGWPYVRTILLRWHVSFCHDLSLIRIYSNSASKFAANTGDTCAPGEPERTFSTDRELPRELAETGRNSDSFGLFGIIFRGIQCGT